MAEGEVLRHAIRGAGATVLSGGLGLVLQTLGTVVLARLLTPSDFGVVTMVTTFSLLLVNFGLNGFTEAIIQREEINRSLITNIFWINIISGLLLALGFAAAGTLLAWFYHDPVVARVAVGVSATIFISSTSVQHLALLKRAMYFSATSTNEVFSRAIALALSVFLAWAGWGYWALVLGVVTQTLAQSVGAWWLCSWVPGLPKRVEGTAALVRFAINVYGRFVVNYFARNTDNLLVGWRFGANSLGFYKKAYDLFALSASQLTAPLTNVAVSAMSRFDPRSQQYRQHFLNAMSVMAFVGMGLSAIFSLIGKDLIRLVLGTGWAPSGQIFNYFAPGIGIMLIYYMHSWIHLSIGEPARWFRWSVVEVFVTCLLLLLALHWGTTGIALAWTGSFWILTIPALWYAGKPIEFGISPMVGVVWRYILAALLAGSATYLIRNSLPTRPASAVWATVGIVSTSLVFGTLYLAAVAVFHWGLTPFRQFAKILQETGLGRRLGLIPPNSVEPLPVADGKVSISEPLKGNPLVSILIPAFNAQEWIADTIQSAIAQTWEPKEIIVVDDGSTDQTLAIAKTFESDSIHVISKVNEGAAAARNKAFSLSRGDYIQWLDADDLLAPDKIARQMAVFDEIGNKRVLLSSEFGKFLNHWHRAEFVPSGLWSDLAPKEWLLRKMGDNLYMQTATWLVSRELTEAAGPWDTRMLSDDDGEYFCRVLLNSDSTRFVPGAKVYYRGFRSNSLAYVGRSNRKRDALWLSMKLHIGYLRSLEESPRTQAASLAYLQRNLINFYPERADIVHEAEEVAADLGGKLWPPHLSWKYSWIRAMFGWRAAKNTAIEMRKIRWAVEEWVDKLVFRLKSRDKLLALPGASPSWPEKSKPQ